jgi:CBS domain-containing protein
MTISALLTREGGVVTIPATSSIADLVELLGSHRIGAVIVSPDGKSVSGIVSERDVVKALRTQSSGLLSQPVSSIMTEHVLTVGPDATFEDLMRIMTERRVRHIPVVDNGQLVGIVSIGDVVKHRIESLETEKNTLIDYITTGR